MIFIWFLEILWWVEELGFGDVYLLDVVVVVEGVDFIVLCVFVGVNEVVVKWIVLVLRVGVIFMDVGLIKKFVVD